MRDATLCFLIKNTENTPTSICLAMKKRGFGKGKWNGVGGKVEQGETIEEAVGREAFEEIGVKLKSLNKVALLTFSFPHKPEWNQLVHAYISSDWENNPSESDEMSPKWFNLTDIPYADMWADDIIWLPKALKGEKIAATFTFDENDSISSQVLEVVDTL